MIHFLVNHNMMIESNVNSDSFPFSPSLHNKIYSDSHPPSLTQIQGRSVELLLGCIHMHDYGESADDLKQALDDLMKSYVNDEKYRLQLISVCCDGAAVNMGRINGTKILNFVKPLLW